MSTTTTDARPCIEVFNILIDGAIRAVGERVAWHRMFALPALNWIMLGLMQRRLQKWRNRFHALVAKIEAGTLRPLPPLGARPRRAGTGPLAEGPRTPGASQRASSCPPREERLPAPVWGWLVRSIGPGVTGFAAPFETILRSPEMLRLIDADPRRMGRILRPICRAFGVVDMPDLLRLPSHAKAPLIDWVEVKRLDAEWTADRASARAAGLPDPPWPGPTPPRTQPKFRFFVTTRGPDGPYKRE